MRCIFYKLAFCLDFIKTSSVIPLFLNREYWRDISDVLYLSLQLIFIKQSGLNWSLLAESTTSQFFPTNVFKITFPFKSHFGFIKEFIIYK